MVHEKLQDVALGRRSAQLLSMLRSGRDRNNNREWKILINALDRMRIVPCTIAQHTP